MLMACEPRTTIVEYHSSLIWFWMPYIFLQDGTSITANQTTESTDCDFLSGHIAVMRDYVSFYQSEFDISEARPIYEFSLETVSRYGEVPKTHRFTFKFDRASSEQVHAIITGIGEPVGSSGDAIILSPDPEGSGVFLHLESIQKVLIPSYSFSLHMRRSDYGDGASLNVLLPSKGGIFFSTRITASETW